MTANSSVFVTSTGTEVGKTLFSRLIINCWSGGGERIGYFKSVASGCEETDWGYRSPDEVDVIEHTDLTEEDATASFRFDAPLSPDQAAKREGRQFTNQEIEQQIATFKESYDRLVVEGIGGVAVPFNESEDVSDLIASLDYPALLVVPSTLGTISYTRTAIHYMRSAGCDPRAIVLTPEKGRDIERINRDHLRDMYPDLEVGLLPDADEATPDQLLSRVRDICEGSDLL